MCDRDRKWKQKLRTYMYKCVPGLRSRTSEIAPESVVLEPESDLELRLQHFSVISLLVSYFSSEPFPIWPIWEMGAAPRANVLSVNCSYQIPRDITRMCSRTVHTGTISFASVRCPTYQDAYRVPVMLQIVVKRSSHPWGFRLLLTLV